MGKTNILLLGSTGMAGHLIYFHLKNTNKYNIINVSYRTKLEDDTIIQDVKDLAALEKLLLSLKPDYIINCIGVLIQGSNNIENAVFINAYLPHFLKKTADKMHAHLIHISTDCVFSGKNGSYRENSFKDADYVYGRSKALGEINDPPHITLRTSLIGPELKSNGEGLFHWFMTQSGEVNGYTNSIWSGITTLELAKAIEFQISSNMASGIVHLSNGEKISKYDLLKSVQSIWNIETVKINPYLGEYVDKSLIKSKWFKYEVPSYEVMLNELIIWMQDHRYLYNYPGKILGYNFKSQLKIDKSEGSIYQRT